jgi:hypothetical protein
MRLVTLTMIRAASMYDDEGNAIQTTTPVRVNPEHVRSFNPRRDDKPGTRITFATGRGFAVTEDFDAVSAALAAAPLALTHQG